MVMILLACIGYLGIYNCDDVFIAFSIRGGKCWHGDNDDHNDIINNNDDNNVLVSELTLIIMVMTIMMIFLRVYLALG